MTIPALGMDHPHYAYSAMPTRPALAWPGKARLAVSIHLHVEYFHLPLEAGQVRASRYNHRAFPDILHHTWFEYGNRVAIFRILDALEKRGLTCSIAINAMAAERYPDLVRRLVAGGHEFIAHGVSATQMLSSNLDREAEAQVIRDVTRTIADATGQRPRGWLSQDFGNSQNTPGLLAEAGYEYVADWPNDDQPYWIADNRMVSLPNHVSWDDMHIVWDRNLLPWRYPDLIGEAAALLHEEGGMSGRFMSIGLHPWLMGAAHRIAYLEQALDRITALPHVWNASASEIAAFWRTSEQAASAKVSA